MKLVFLLPLAWLALRLFGFKRVRYLAERRLSAGPATIDQAAMQRAQRSAQLVAIASRHGLYAANCLNQSVVLCRILCKQGMPAQIRIGVRPKAQPFEAHAWVELEGVPLGQSVTDYRAFSGLTLNSEQP